MAPKTELGNAAFYCSPGSLRSALKRGANPNDADPDTKKTALMWLCEMHDKHTRARKRMFRALVKAGARLDSTDVHGVTAWEYARLGAARGFKTFVKREYQRRLGRVPSRTALRAQLP